MMVNCCTPLRNLLSTWAPEDANCSAELYMRLFSRKLLDCWLPPMR